MSERYEVIEIFGQRALFANHHVDAKDAPGMNVYYIRGGLDGTFATIEPFVGVDLVGSVITKEPIDLGWRGYISFTDETDPCFTGIETTIGQFSEGNNYNY